MNKGQSSALTPWEWAYELQRQHGFSDSSVAADVCDVLAANLLGALPPNQRSILEQYPIIVLQTRSVNAMCIAEPSGSAVIAIDYGLMSFLNVLNKAVLCRLNQFGMEPSLSVREATDHVQRAVDHFFGGKGEVPRWPVSPRRMLIASALSNVQVAFVVGHEIGHVFLGHLGTHTAAQIVESKALSSSVFSFENAQNQEFAADHKAATLVMKHFARIYDPLFGSNEPSYAQAGVDVFFTYLGMIEGLSQQDDQKVSIRTHPPCELRKKKLREAMWESLPGTSRQLADSFAVIIEGFASSMRAPRGKT